MKNILTKCTNIKAHCNCTFYIHSKTVFTLKIVYYVSNIILSVEF